MSLKLWAQSNGMQYLLAVYPVLTSIHHPARAAAGLSAHLHELMI
jgi:hypothetical protein